jgi:glycosyltransferase involved in cell wall biosynthesis
MRFVVATCYTLPGCSGGWTTTLDLLRPEHDAVYVTETGGPGTVRIEGVTVHAPGRMVSLLSRTLPARLGERFGRRCFAWRTVAAFHLHRADAVLCLDLTAASAVVRTGLPHALRMHTPPRAEEAPLFERVSRGALFMTCAVANPFGIPVLRHGEDLSRYSPVPRGSLESAVLVTTLVEAERPDIFIEGVRLAGIRGVVAGDGPMRDEVARACEATAGRVRLSGPVRRLALPGLLADHQAGVACLREGWHNNYQMKVTQYQAAGLFPLVQPWSELAVEAPGLTMTFRDAGELADRLTLLRRDWGTTEAAREAGRAWALERYDIPAIKRRFAEIVGSGGGARRAPPRTW